MVNVRMAADQLAVAPSTIRRWSGEFEEFLAPAANPALGEPRFYTKEDLAILNTILVLRGQRQPFAAIREALGRGERLEPLAEVHAEPSAAPESPTPPPAAPVETQLVPYGMVEKFMTMFEQSNTARIVAESRAASEQARADMLQAQLDQMQETAVTVESAPEDGSSGAAAGAAQEPVPAQAVPAQDAAAGADGVETTAGGQSRKGFLSRAWAAWVYLIEKKAPE